MINDPFHRGKNFVTVGTSLSYYPGTDIPAFYCFRILGVNMKKLCLYVLSASVICFASLSHAQNILQIQTKSGPVPVTHEGLQSVLWMQTSAEYHILCQTMFNQAKQALDTGLKDKNWTAFPEQTQDYSNLPPAVILDIDETVLDNSPFQGEVAKRDAGYEKDLWTKWANMEKCDGVPGAFNFIEYAQLKGVTVFFITNRESVVEPATRSNLARLGVKFASKPEDTVLTQDEKGWCGSDKTARRAYVAATHRILLLVGDDLGDFVSVAKASPEERLKIAEPHNDKWGVKWFLLPNPAYGSWEGSLYKFNYELKRPDILKIKWDLLKGFR